MGLGLLLVPGIGGILPPGTVEADSIPYAAGVRSSRGFSIRSNRKHTGVLGSTNRPLCQYVCAQFSGSHK